MGKACHLGAVDAFVVGHVSGHDPDEVVGITGHQMAAQGFGNLEHGGLELVEVVLLLAGERDLDEHGRALPEARTIDRGAVATDHARFFEPSDPAKTGRRGQVDTLGERGMRHASVGLQEVEDGSVGCIEIDRQLNHLRAASIAHESCADGA